MVPAERRRKGGQFSIGAGSGVFRRRLQLTGRRRGTQLDLNEFYSCSSRNLEWSIAKISTEIAEVEASSEVALDRAWYRSSRSALAAEQVAAIRPDRLLTSTRQRLKRAVRLADPGELLVLGFSYDQLFAQASRAIHFGPHSPDYRPGLESVVGDIDECAVLGFNVIVRLQRLLDRVPEGPNTVIREQFDRNELPAELVERRTRSMAEVGDFVLAHGDLGEVLEVVESKFRYRSYRILYLAQRPLPELNEDWFLAQHVQVLFAHAKTVELLAARSEPPIPDHLREKLVEPGNEYVRSSMRELWDRVLRDYIRAQHGRPLTGTPEQLLDQAEEPTQGDGEEPAGDDTAGS